MFVKFNGGYEKVLINVCNFFFYEKTNKINIYYINYIKYT